MQISTVKIVSQKSKVLQRLLFTVALCVLIIAVSSVYAADQVRSSEFLVASSDTAVSSTINPSFTLYIGDNLSGVTNPLKSLYFTVSGFYTDTGSGGTFALSIDSDSATTQTFTLPHVTVPTPFEFVYSDPTNKINPTSAGSYAHTLNIVPTTVTAYGLGVRATETHRFVPASCPDGSTDKVKTNEFLIANYSASFSSATTSAFTFYIGDNLAGVTSPIKSLHYVFHGVYTGSGSVALSLDGDSATSQTFTLPSVSVPTYVELIYKDPADTIHPTSAGSYTHSITISPSGVTLYSLDVILAETHRYKPSACGGMPAKGEVYSAVFDTTGTTTGPTYNGFLWKGVLGGPGADQGHVRFQLAASDCSNGATNYPTCSVGTWGFIGGPTCASSDWFDPGAPDTSYDLQSSSCIASWNNRRYFRYVVELCSDDCTASGSYTPRVDDVIVNWAP